MRVWIFSESEPAAGDTAFAFIDNPGGSMFGCFMIHELWSDLCVAVGRDPTGLTLYESDMNEEQLGYNDVTRLREDVKSAFYAEESFSRCITGWDRDANFVAAYKIERVSDECVSFTLVDKISSRLPMCTGSIVVCPGDGGKLYKLSKNGTYVKMSVNEQFAFMGAYGRAGYTEDMTIKEVRDSCSELVKCDMLDWDDKILAKGYPDDYGLTMTVGEALALFKDGGKS